MGVKVAGGGAASRRSKRLRRVQSRFAAFKVQGSRFKAPAARSKFKVGAVRVIGCRLPVIWFSAFPDNH
jgi:hypothetical protein